MRNFDELRREAMADPERRKRIVRYEREFLASIPARTEEMAQEVIEAAAREPENELLGRLAEAAEALRYNRGT